ncbi:MAG: XRE family transcriptional regulator [Rhodococcus sp. (in: high G+C Gram-positive bacteria)]
MTTQIEGHRWVPTLSTFGARLALVRHQMGWNAKEAALACGLPAASWREWELRGREPRGLSDIAQKISEHTGCDDYWLITGRESPRPEDPDGGSTVRHQGFEPRTR